MKEGGKNGKKGRRKKEKKLSLLFFRKYSQHSLRPNNKLGISGARNQCKKKKSCERLLV